MGQRCFDATAGHEARGQSRYESLLGLATRQEEAHRWDQVWWQPQHSGMMTCCASHDCEHCGSLLALLFTTVLHEVFFFEVNASEVSVQTKVSCEKGMVLRALDHWLRDHYDSRV